MLHIFVMHGEVVQVIEDSVNPPDRMLKEGKDYSVEYLPKDDWLTPEVYDPKKGLQGDAEEDGHVICNHPGKPHEK